MLCASYRHGWFAALPAGAVRQSQSKGKERLAELAFALAKLIPKRNIFSQSQAKTRQAEQNVGVRALVTPPHTV